MQFSHETPLTKDQVEEMEVKIAEGDLHSMTYVTADALKFHLDDAEVLEHRKNLVLHAENKCNRAVLRNLALLAAYTDDIKMADFLNSLFYQISDFVSPYRASSILRKSAIPSSVKAGNLYLRELAEHGYFRARSRYFRLKVKRWGILGSVAWLFYLIYLLPQMIWVVLKDQNDPRVYYD